MSRFIIVLCLLLSVSSFAEHREPQPNAVVSREKVGRKLTRLNDLITETLGKARGRPMQEDLRRLRAEVDELRDLIASAPDYYEPAPVIAQPPPPNLPPPPPNLPPPGRIQVQPISPQSLSQLVSAINRESFSDGKVRVLQTAVQGQFFLVGQAKQLLNAYTFSQDKLTAASLLAPRILDSQNAFQLYDSLTMSDDKAKLRQILDSGLPRSAPRRSPPRDHRPH